MKECQREETSVFRVLKVTEKNHTIYMLLTIAQQHRSTNKNPQSGEFTW